MSIWEELANNKAMTDTEQVIAKWLQNNPDKVADMKLAVAAKAMNVSESAAIRFCKKMGFHGYKDFQLAFVTENEKRRREKRNVDFNYPFAPNESTADIIRNHAELIKETVDVCYSSIPKDRLVRAADWIFHSRHLYLYGAGDSYISALSFANRLTKIGIAPVMPMQFFEISAVTRTASKEDIAIVVSYSGRLLDSLSDDLKVLHNRKCRVIVISSVDYTPYADLLIRIPRKEDLKNKISVYYSQTAFNYVFSCLFGIIYSMDYEGNIIRMMEY